MKTGESSELDGKFFSPLGQPLWYTLLVCLSLSRILKYFFLLGSTRSVQVEWSLVVRSGRLLDGAIRVRSNVLVLIFFNPPPINGRYLLTLFTVDYYLPLIIILLFCLPLIINNKIDKSGLYFLILF